MTVQHVLIDGASRAQLGDPEDGYRLWIETTGVWLPEHLMPRDTQPDLPRNQWCGDEHVVAPVVCNLPWRHVGLHQAGDGEGRVVAIWSDDA